MRTFSIMAALLVPAASLSGQPKLPTVRLAVVCVGPPCRFRQGEVIPVELNLSTDVAGFGVFRSYPVRFEFGELDGFVAKPKEGAVDPVDPVRMMHAGSWNPNLEALTGLGELPIRLELNQWLSFERPGRYEVTATSQRICKMVGNPMQVWGSAHCAALTSNPVDIEVVAAEPQWQREQLERRLRELPQGPSLTILTPAQKVAMRALIYLGTDDALQEIRKWLAAGFPRDLTHMMAEQFVFRKTGR
jgi:hypothetical protein